MTQQPQQPSDVLGALPHRRPSRRSEKRGTSARAHQERTAGAASAPPRPERTAGAASAPPRSERTASPPPSDAGARRDRRPPPSAPRGTEIVGTAVQAAAELAEIGLS